MLNTKVANSCFKIPLGSFPSSFHFLLTSLITKIVFKKGIDSFKRAVLQGLLECMPIRALV